MLFGLYLAWSGAPARVHYVDGAALLMGFTLPNLSLVLAGFSRAGWIIAIVTHCVATVCWHFALATVVAKAEAHIVSAVAILPFSVIGFCLHVGLSHVLAAAARLSLPISQS
jgi:hypothetical protein